MAYYQKPGRGKSAPIKMASEKMKSTTPILALVGDQHKLPEHLKKEILKKEVNAKEDSPATMYGAPAKIEGDRGPLKMYKSSPLQNCPDCPKETDSLSGDTVKVKTGGRIRNKRYELNPKVKEELDSLTRERRKKTFADRVAKGQMTQEFMDRLIERDKNRGFH